MKLLLDTHIWVRSQLNPERLSRRVARAINDPRNELWISPISTWEIVLLCERGRLKLDGGPEVWMQKALTVAPLREAPLSMRSHWRHARLAFLIAILLIGCCWRLR